jgi:cytidyltransferase-like protein
MQVMVFGCFDKLHDGHRALFAQGREHGTLTVVVARDCNIEKFKQRTSRLSENERLRAVEAEPLVNIAILGNNEDILHVVEQEQPDMILLGYDQETLSESRLIKELVARDLSIKIQRAQPYDETRLKSSKLL